MATPATADNAEVSGSTSRDFPRLFEGASDPAARSDRAGDGRGIYSDAKVYIKESDPQVDRETERPHHSTDDAALRDAAQGVARKARDAFRDACRTLDPDRGECSFMAMTSSLDELWDYAKYRDVPFRDLLGMLDAATKCSDIKDFGSEQRDALCNALNDLTSWLLDYEAVHDHIRRFAELGIDVTGPIRNAIPRRMRITIEELE